MHSRPLTFVCLALSLLLGVLPAPVAQAAPFPRTTIFAGDYLMGTASLAEYDAYVAMYPGIASGCGFTFSRNGTVDVVDELDGQVEHGTYVRFSGNSRVTVTLTSTTSPWGPVTYELYRVGNTSNWWGEIRIGGAVFGHFRGTLN